MQTPFLPTIDSDNIIKNVLRKLNKQGDNCLIHSAARGITGDACISGVKAGELSKDLVCEKNKTELELMASQSTKSGEICYFA